MKTSQSKSKLVQDLKAITGDKYILTADWNKQPYLQVLEEAREILETETDEKKDEKVNVDIDLLINIRNKARLKKDWNLSDQVRDILTSNNIEIEDNSDGSKCKSI